MIMDPGMDGLDTYAKIVELYGRQKAVIASGFSETERVKEAQRLGAGPCVMKPYSTNQIGQAIHAMLNEA
jgi:DNA-binding NarL/FixJ family response regulator